MSHILLDYFLQLITKLLEILPNLYTMLQLRKNINADIAAS